MTHAPDADTSPTGPDPSYEGKGDTGAPEDAAFPALDFPGAESLAGAERRRLTPTFLGGAEDQDGALGTHGFELVILGDRVCVVEWVCVEQSELFPSVCNRWQPVTIAC